MKFENDIKIIINRAIYQEMIKCVKKASPNEACGLIFGDIKQVKISGSEEFQYHYITKRFNCIESNQKSPIAFLIDDLEKLDSIFKKAAREYNLRLISIFHSHPSGAYPSNVDTKNMKFLDNCGNKGFKNQIWTIMDAKSEELNGFIYFNKQFMQINVNLIGN